MNEADVNNELNQEQRREIAENLGINESDQTWGLHSKDKVHLPSLPEEEEEIEIEENLKVIDVAKLDPS